MEEAERKIRCEAPPGGSRVHTLWRLFEEDPAARTKIHLDAEYSRSSEGRGPATRPGRKGKKKTPERPWRPAEGHPNDSDRFVTCSDGDGCDCRHRDESTGCKVGAPRAGGGGGEDTPPSSGGEGPPPPYRSRESTHGSPLPRSEPRWGDMDIDNDMEFDLDAVLPSGGRPPYGGRPGSPGGGPLVGPRGGGPPSEPPHREPPDKGPPGGPPGGDPLNELLGPGFPEDIWRCIVYLNRRIWELEREANIKNIEIGKSAAVFAKAEKELDIAKFEARKLSSVVTRL